jgi:hypothetical protein
MELSMNLLKRCVSLIFFFSVCSFLPVGQASGITSDADLRTPAYWQGLSSTNNDVVLNDAAKKSFNQKMRAASPSMVDLKSYPASKMGADLRKMIEASSTISGVLYDENGQALTEAGKAAFSDSLNLSALAKVVKVRQGVVIRHANLRTLPTAQPLFSEPEVSMFDILQETAVDPSEPVVILHTSQSGEYYYVQMYNYRGWIAASDVAIVTDKKKWLNYVDPKAFLVVTDKSYAVTQGSGEVFYQMGSRLPLVKKDKNSYTVFLPQRDSKGQLLDKFVKIRKAAALHEGYLPYTRNNLIQEAFCYLDEPYGWGGLGNSVDCSSLISNVYRTVGIALPRNADEQEGTAGQHFSFAGLDESGVLASIHKNLKPGDTLHMDGHVMMYLGEVDGVAYAIHSLGSYTEFYADGQREKQHILRVVVSDLSLKTGNGASFADALTSAVSFHS